jgi:hypothetical protein
MIRRGIAVVRGVGDQHRGEQLDVVAEPTVDDQV